MKSPVIVRVFPWLIPLFVGNAAHAQSTQGYPNRPIRFLVGFAPGGFTDVMARAIAGKLSESWGQQVILDNRLGASTTIAADLTAKSEAVKWESWSRHRAPRQNDERPRQADSAFRP